MKLSLPFSLLILAGITTLQCAPSDSAQKQDKFELLSEVVMEDSLVMPFPYDLTKPDRKISLPLNLSEVSALSYFSENKLVMVQDENGIIYVLDLLKEEITNTSMFRMKGDFEGVEVVEDTAYALRSDGDIYQVTGFMGEDPQTVKYETILSQKDDTEGLGFDPKTRSLLVACKEPRIINDETVKHERMVASFDLHTMQIDTEPRMIIDLREIQAFMLQHAQGEDGLAEAREFDPQKAGSFKPSGLAVHPVTGYIFVIASNGQLLVVFNNNHQVVQVQNLDRKVFGQPEGICFSPDGDLFISNEGRGERGNVLMFEYRLKP